MTDYRIDILSPAGVKVAETSDYTALKYLKKRNAAGLASFDLPAGSPALAYCQNWGIVEIWRRSSSFAWYRDFVGFIRGISDKYSNARRTYTVRAPGILSLLGTRVVAWYANTASRSLFSAVAAETIIKTLVSYNAGSSATVANGRLREGAISGLTVEADSGRGNILSVGCAYDNILSIIQKVASIGGGDFDLVKTGGAAYQLRYYPGQLGTDRTASVLFSLARGNLADPELRTDYQSERTVAIVGGQGEGSARAIAIRTGTGYSASNNTELFYPQTNTTTAAILQAAGDRVLYDARATTSLSFDVLQTPASVYGSHYFLGDLVAAEYESYSEDLIVDEVSVDFTDRETIKIRMATL